MRSSRDTADSFVLISENTMNSPSDLTDDDDYTYGR
jgi:hypothetical protein